MCTFPFVLQGAWHQKMVLAFFHLFAHPSLKDVRNQMQANIAADKQHVPDLIMQTFSVYHAAVYKTWKENEFKQFLLPVTVNTVKLGKWVEYPGQPFQLFKYEHDY